MTIDPGDAMTCELSIVVPALDEEENVAGLVEEVQSVIIDAGVDAELIVVDDGSTDRTPAHLRELAAGRPWMRVLRSDATTGLSPALHAGFAASAGTFVSTLDADLQNDPADLIRMLVRARTGDVDMIQGDRTGDRRDHAVRRAGSAVGRWARAWIVGDPTRDTGCATRLMRRGVALRFPLQFRGIHRFMPACARMTGARVIEMPVNHRPRAAGRSKFGMGVLSRAVPGLMDALAVRWMVRRYHDPGAVKEQR